MVPSKEEFLEFLRLNPDQTYSSIAKGFNISNQTVKDLVETYREELEVKKIGPSYLVNIKKQ